MWTRIDGFIPEPEVWPSEWAKHLGISLKEVALSDKGHLQFNPSFFNPLEPSFQEKYPIDKHHRNYDPRELHLPFPVWEDILGEITKDTYKRLRQGLPAFMNRQYSGKGTPRYPTWKVAQETILARARSLYQLKLRICTSRRPGGTLSSSAPDSTSLCIESYVTAPRKNLPYSKLTAIQASPWVSVYLPDPPFNLRGFTLNGSWKGSQMLAIKEESLEHLPHAIIAITVQVEA
ncbi:hypothetical protein N7540_003231 [Penicillium herquei]|nr:hypothetical protein N7540_003231 [Penicillium herquei]